MLTFETDEGILAIAVLVVVVDIIPLPGGSQTVLCRDWKIQHTIYFGLENIFWTHQKWLGKVV